ncbi:redoxin family protein [Mucilaginibacter sp. 21P]|uniref:TlpA family protein disulfide reductase n=1 Tax=Mucilaginibacter sp. 21P TaxID=2778902 RepID=UPI001C583E14|nr:thioredoxin-like domain-containing protein [Mucilaginibacter sp. 21P]QXV65892.1 redoxin family protein [Mucilaginibacter sp. 21P]
MTKPLKPLLFSITLLLLYILIPTICLAQAKNPGSTADSSTRSSITIILPPKQTLELVSNYVDLISFKNDDDLVKKVTIRFSFNKVKELRTGYWKLSQTVLLFPNSHPEFMVVNYKLIANNTAAKQAILPDDIGHTGRIYSLLMDQKYSKLDTAASAAFLKDREKELNEDSIKIKQMVNSGEWTANTGTSWQLLREITDIPVIFNAVKNTWLNKHRKDIYEHYYAKLSEISKISGPSATLATSSLALYWEEINRNNPSLSWVDFYLQNQALIGKEIIDQQFRNAVKNITSSYKMTRLYKSDLQKIMLYAKANDSSLYNLITRRKDEIIPNLQNVLLQDKTGHFQNLASIFNKTNKKYIFIDFWASWCAPCREALPDIKKLKPELYNNDIAIISISVDQQVGPWQTAMAQEGLKQDVFQYRLVNSATKPHALTNFFDLSRVPRYAVVAKDGKVLIRETDYSPRDKEFRNEIISSTK